MVFNLGYVQTNKIGNNGKCRIAGGGACGAHCDGYSYANTYYHLLGECVSVLMNGQRKFFQQKTHKMWSPGG